jgi:hypothetical protein
MNGEKEFSCPVNSTKEELLSAEIQTQSLLAYAAIDKYCWPKSMSYKMATGIRRMLDLISVYSSEIVNTDFEKSELLLNLLRDIALFTDKSFEPQAKLMPLANKILTKFMSSDNAGNHGVNLMWLKLLYLLDLILNKQDLSCYETVDKLSLVKVAHKLIIICSDDDWFDFFCRWHYALPGEQRLKFTSRLDSVVLKNDISFDDYNLIGAHLNIYYELKNRAPGCLCGHVR